MSEEKLHYAYYPGCSMSASAHAYGSSIKHVNQVLGLEFEEIEDWNCCGATAYFHVDELLAYTLVARNLALAERMGLDFVAPCSGCYKNAYFTSRYLQHDPDLADHINVALQEDNLHVSGTTKVRHLLEIFVEDVGLEGIRRAVSSPLKNLRVAPLLRM